MGAAVLQPGLVGSPSSLHICTADITQLQAAAASRYTPSCASHAGGDISRMQSGCLPCPSCCMPPCYSQPAMQARTTASVVVSRHAANVHAARSTSGCRASLHGCGNGPTLLFLAHLQGHTTDTHAYTAQTRRHPLQQGPYREQETTPSSMRIVDACRVVQLIHSHVHAWDQAQAHRGPPTAAHVRA